MFNGEEDIARDFVTPPRNPDLLAIEDARSRDGPPRGPRVDRAVRNLFHRKVGPTVIASSMSSEGLTFDYNRALELSYFEQAYSKLKCLGAGSFGVVHKALYDGKKLCAVKVSRLKRHYNYAVKEVRNFEKIGYHRHVVKFLSAWEEDQIVYIKMECCKSSLADYILSSNRTRLPEPDLWGVFYDMLNALKYLHCKQLIHFDVKPANILTTVSGYFKLGDFGLLIDLNEIDENLASTCDGDAKYLAKEVLNNIYTPASDVFALGISLLELASCDIFTLPSDGETWQRLRSDVLDDDFFFNRYSPQFEKNIRDMLREDYKARPSAESLFRRRVNYIHNFSSPNTRHGKQSLNPVDNVGAMAADAAIYQRNVQNDTPQRQSISGVMPLQEYRHQRSYAEALAQAPLPPNEYVPPAQQYVPSPQNGSQAQGGRLPRYEMASIDGLLSNYAASSTRDGLLSRHEPPTRDTGRLQRYEVENLSGLFSHYEYVTRGNGLLPQNEVRPQNQAASSTRDGLLPQNGHFRQNEGASSTRNERLPENGVLRQYEAAPSRRDGFVPQNGRVRQYEAASSRRDGVVPEFRLFEPSQYEDLSFVQRLEFD